MPHTFAEFGADRAGVTVVAVCRNPVRGHTRDGLRGLEERLRGFQVGLIEGKPELSPVVREHEGELVALQRAIVAGKADVAVELRNA